MTFGLFAVKLALTVPSRPALMSAIAGGDALKLAANALSLFAPSSVVCLEQPVLA